MRTKLFCCLVLACATSFLSNNSLGQFPITITLPKLPKIGKSKPAPTPAAPSENPVNAAADAANSAAAPSTSSSSPTSASQAAPSKDDCDSFDPMDRSLLGIYKKDLQTTLADARSFSPGRKYYVGDLSDNRNEYLLAVISPKGRAELEKYRGKFVKCMEPLLAELSAEVKRGLPTFKLTGYDLHDPVGERAMRAAVQGIGQMSVYKVGLYSPNWLFEKNDLGLPVYRFKYGAIWVKDPRNDDPYCRILYVKVVQDYAGGGTWGGSYGSYYMTRPAGCPDGK